LGKVIRIRVSGDETDQIRVAGRQTQGVTLFSIDSEEKVVSVGLIQEKDTGEDDMDENTDAHNPDNQTGNTEEQPESNKTEDSGTD
jgi:DNA gyrase subunit A